MRDIFIHIPKCGGNSIEGKLRCNSIPYTRVEPFTPNKVIRESGIVTGHFEYSKFSGDVDDRFFSILRTPIDRAISHYHYCFANKEHNPEYPFIKDMSIEDFLDRYIPDNYMARYIIGSAWFDSENTDEKRFDECISVMNERYMAIGRIEAVVYFDNWLASRFGGFPVIAHDNANAHDDSVATDAKMRFVKRNTVDYMLYEYVGNLWVNPKFKK